MIKLLKEFCKCPACSGNKNMEWWEVNATQKPGYKYTRGEIKRIAQLKELNKTTKLRECVKDLQFDDGSEYIYSSRLGYSNEQVFYTCTHCLGKGYVSLYWAIKTAFIRNIINAKEKIQVKKEPCSFGACYAPKGLSKTESRYMSSTRFIPNDTSNPPEVCTYKSIPKEDREYFSI